MTLTAESFLGERAGLVSREEVVAEARGWVRTPHVHQGALLGVGADCVGLLVGVSIRLGLLDPGFVDLPETARYKGYSRTPSGGDLQRACETFMTRIARESAGAADAVLIQFSGQPHHLGLLAPYRFGGLAIIHSMAVPGYVAEHRLSSAWQQRIIAAYRLPGIEA